MKKASVLRSVRCSVRGDEDEEQQAAGSRESAAEPSHGRHWDGFSFLFKVLFIQYLFFVPCCLVFTPENLR